MLDVKLVAGQPFEGSDTLRNSQVHRTFFPAMCCAASINVLT